MKWTPDKPEFKEDCVLVTAIKMNKVWEYSLWLIEKQVDYEGGGYWGWLTGDGEEYGDIADLKADLYLILPKIKQ